MTAAPPHQILSATLREPNEIGQLAPWDLDFRQLSPGSGQTELRLRQGQMIAALSIRIPCKVHQIGEAPPDMLTFGYAKTGAIKSWQGADAPAQSFVCFGSGDTFDGISAKGFEAVTFSIPQEALQALALDFGLEPTGTAFRPGLADLAHSTRPAQLLARKSAQMLQADPARPGPEIEEEIGLALLLIANAPHLRVDARAQRLRDRALARALEAINAQIDAPPSVRELCKQAGASWPTLHRAFVDRFGVGPKTYLSTLRLNRARTQLLAADAAARVADVANGLGFWHMGQFASDYRKLFNRLPSEDLRGGG